jgi:shikimate kinase
MTASTPLDRPIVLIGPPGAGKSTVAGVLAHWLGVSVRDTDVDIEQTVGTSIADIFIDRGEAEFRRLERAAVHTALAEHRGVLALGGGAVLDPETRLELAGHTVVFLDVGITDAARRIGFNRDRPLLIGNPRGRWMTLMADRRPVYEQLAGCVVSTDGRTAQEVASAVLAALDHPAESRR